MRADSENTWKTELFHSFSGMSLGNTAQVRVALGLLSGEKPVLGCRESPGAGWSRAALLPLAMRTTLCREGTCTGTGGQLWHSLTGPGCQSSEGTRRAGLVWQGLFVPLDRARAVSRRVTTPHFWISLSSEHGAATGKHSDLPQLLPPAPTSALRIIPRQSQPFHPDPSPQGQTPPSPTGLLTE